MIDQLKLNRRIKKEMKRLGLSGDRHPMSSVSDKLFWLIITRAERARKRAIL